MNKKIVSNLAERRKRRARVAKTRLMKEKRALRNTEGNNADDCVYLIQHGRTPIYKIGYGNPSKRLGAMQTGNPAHLRIVRATHLGPLCRTAEKWLHKKYNEYKINSEWFYFDQDLLVKVKEDFILIRYGVMPKETNAIHLLKKEKDSIGRWVCKQFGYKSLSEATLDESLEIPGEGVCY